MPLAQMEVGSPAVSCLGGTVVIGTARQVVHYSGVSAAMAVMVLT